MTCPTCNGEGIYGERTIGGDGYGDACAALADVPAYCLQCRGTGEVCNRCQGFGYVMTDPGTDDGSGVSLLETPCPDCEEIV